MALSSSFHCRYAKPRPIFTASPISTALIAPIKIDSARCAAHSQPMQATLEPLILDFLEWLADRPRAYDDVNSAWRTSCPRLTVWEDALDAGFVTRRARAGQGWIVEVTDLGRAHLDRARR
jgi:hypothetical protein